MENEHEPIGGGAIASPSGKPKALDDSGGDQGNAGYRAVRQPYPEQ